MSAFGLTLQVLTFQASAAAAVRAFEWRRLSQGAKATFFLLAPFAGIASHSCCALRLFFAGSSLFPSL